MSFMFRCKASSQLVAEHSSENSQPRSSCSSSHQMLEDAPDGPVPASLQKRIPDPVLRVYTLIPGFMALGAVGLMTLKLDWIGSILALVIAFAVSILAGQLVRGTPNNAQIKEKEVAMR